MYIPYSILHTSKSHTPYLKIPPQNPIFHTSKSHTPYLKIPYSIPHTCTCTSHTPYLKIPHSIPQNPIFQNPIIHTSTSHISYLIHPYSISLFHFRSFSLTPCLISFIVVSFVMLRYFVTLVRLPWGWSIYTHRKFYIVI